MQNNIHILSLAPKNFFDFGISLKFLFNYLLMTKYTHATGNSTSHIRSTRIPIFLFSGNIDTGGSTQYCPIKCLIKYNDLNRLANKYFRSKNNKDFQH